MILKKILENKKNGNTQIAVLVDPDKYNSESIGYLIDKIKDSPVCMFLVGGSILNNPIDETIKSIKKYSDIPVVLFPGSLMQLSNKADGILFLSLISGRNSDFLIGNHVNAAYYIKESGMQVIPTGYILIESGKTTSVEYMSNTKPIPANKIDIAVATAIAGELLGNKMIYLEAGSGADNSISTDLIKQIEKNISIPLIVGGGITTRQNFNDIQNAGADIIVLGNVLEKNPDFIKNIL